MWPARRAVKRQTLRRDAEMTRDEKVPAFTNEIVGVAKRLFGEIVGSQKGFKEGKTREGDTHEDR
jgi:hypothetical protein